MKLSIIIPVFNEEKTVEAILKKIEKVKLEDFEKEVIVVDDGSTDTSVSVISNLKSQISNLKFVLHKKNLGKGAAVRTGLKQAIGDYVIIQDADLEYDPGEYKKILVPVLKWNADVVFGSRVLGPEMVRVHYLWNQIGNRALTWFFNLLYNKTFTDVYTCYFLYKRSLVNLRHLKTVGFEQQAEIICHCLRQTRSIYEVPISYFGRTIEEGKKIKARHAFSCFKTVFLQRFFPPKSREKEESPLLSPYPRS